jgi:membrane fusion protein, multidrug efflux system
MIKKETNERTAGSDVKTAAPDAAEAPASPKTGHRKRWIFIGVGVLVLGGVIWQLAGHPGFRSKPPPVDVRPVPVAAAAVLQKDVPIYLEGLGTVTALYTVTVKTQVDGRLDKMFFVEGQRVKKGELIALVDPRPFEAALHQAEATVARDQANLVNAKLNLKRYEELSKQNLIAVQQATDQQAMVDQLAATVMIDRAQVETARLNLEYAHIISPVDGVTGIRLVDPGNIIHAADTTGIVVITQLDPIAVIFTLPQDNLPDVSEAMRKGELTVDAFDRSGGAKLGTGKVLLIDNQINQTTATIRLKALFPNPEAVLWPNQFVKARLLLNIQKDAIVIPTPAVQRGPKGTFVYVIGGDSTVSVRPVVIETTQGDQTLLASGAKPGEQVVIDGQNQIRPGSKVAVRAPEGSGTPAASKADAGP